MLTQQLADPLRLFDLRDASVVVTGASGAFGRAAALALGSLGARLTLASGSRDELDAVVAEVKEVGAAVVGVYCRPETPEAAERIVQAGVHAHGGVDRLVVASGMNRPGFIQDMSVDDWHAVLDANATGAWLMAQAVGRRWIADGTPGKVLLVSSVRGRHGNVSGYTAYCASKGATDALTRVLATEWARYGITVNAIAPTVFRSKLTDWMYGDDELGQATKARSLSRIPLGRLGEPEDLVGPAVFLLSEASGFCTGQVLYVDGGYTAG